MALDFSTSNDAILNCTNVAPLSNIQAGTIVAWVRPTSFSTLRRLYQKSNSIFACLDVAASPGLLWLIGRATAQLRIEAQVSSMPARGTGKHCFTVVSWNVNGTDSDQHFYAGDLTTPVAEASAYAIQTVG